MNFDLTEEQILLQKSIKQFSDREIEPIAAKIDREGKLPDNLIHKMADLGLFGLAVPREYGGTGMGQLNCILVCEQLAYSGAGAWWLTAFNNSIPDTIAQFGNDYIKNNFLKPLCDGSAYASIQFTEADTGSDPKSLVARVIPDNDHYIANGMKRFSTFGARDGYAMFFAKDEDDNCTAFIIKKNTPGYSISKMWELTGSGGIEAVDIYLDSMKIPKENMLGTKGKGFDILLYWISVEKIQQCAASVGIAQSALDEAVKFAKSRMNRGKPISDMQGIRWMLADIYNKVQAARWLTYRTAFLKDHDDKNWMTEAASTKLFVVNATIEAVETARQIHGAYGYTRDFKIERLYRAITGASAIAVGLEINKTIVGSALLK
jgi:alkylation response protein AidB-like acyl-CoA dehydrogenase